jgi:hypothetical protein
MVNVHAASDGRYTPACSRCRRFVFPRISVSYDEPAGAVEEGSERLLDVEGSLAVAKAEEQSDRGDGELV